MVELHANEMSDNDNSQPQHPKKLRFITNQGAPNPKRRRITAACLTCRKRKTACSGEQPTCQTCTQNNLECAGFSSNAGEKESRSTSNVKSYKEERIGKTQLNTIGGRRSPIRHTSGGDDGPRIVRSAEAPRPSIASRPSVASTTFRGQDRSEALFSRTRNRMPYFRWLGPTAIMPGFKQMVVKIKQQDNGALSSTEGEGLSPSLSNPKLNASQREASIYSSIPTQIESDVRTPLALPFYDNSSVPPSELITHLCDTFFVHLSCNFPFLQKPRFLKDLDEKQVDAILVDAVCALAARFSTHTLLTQQSGDGPSMMPSDHGQAFAQRAKAALTDTFAVPSVAAVQAALLLAHNEFGESRDSGLWMYLGISIRMAQDLGLQKLQGLRYEGRDGPTPKMVKTANTGKSSSRGNVPEDRVRSKISPANESREAHEQRAVERERIDTFWAVFFLDTVVSSGTGRRKTLRDNDIELSFPALESPSLGNGWPSPFPALIRIVHLYGRVADVLNSIKEPSDINPETPKRLAEMEAQVTNFYQGLSPRLHFDAMNFHHFVKAGEGTNFILLHFWFHTLIVLLHQPTLLKTFEGRMLQLSPNSQQLSMSSAKTIADILSYSQLIDTKAILGNAFTTQPIYIAACCFLKETAERTATSTSHSRVPSGSGSRATSPCKSADKSSEDSDQSLHRSRGAASSSKVEAEIGTVASGKRIAEAATEKNIAKHTLLATAASQHYHLCFRALESIETYWAGAKYIITVLEQKFKGVGDPLLYTVEEEECSLEQPRPEPTFTSPGWRRRYSWTPSYFAAQPALKSFQGALLQDDASRPAASSAFATDDDAHKMDKSTTPAEQRKAIGWTLTGTLNSPNTNLAWHYPTNDAARGAVASSQHISREALHNSRTTTAQWAVARHTSDHVRSASLGDPSDNSFIDRAPYRPRTASDIDPSLNLPSSYHSHMGNMKSPYAPSFGQMYGMPNDQYPMMPNATTFGDMLIESQDVDMSLLGLDMLPWLDAPNEDMLSVFDIPAQQGLEDLAGHEHDPSQMSPQG